MTKGRPRVGRVTVACHACGVESERRTTEVAKSRTGWFFCSIACKRSVGSKPKRGRFKPCAVCHEPMWVAPHAELTRRTCSRGCQNEFSRRDRVIAICAHCGESREVAPSKAYQFCSKRCEGVAKIARPLGRSHNGKPVRQDNNGYAWVWEPDRSGPHWYKGWMMEHRWVAERLLERPLTADEDVHHINRVRWDNRAENLEVVDAKTHARIHGEQRRNEAQLLAEYIRRFGPLDKED